MLPLFFTTLFLVLAASSQAWGKLLIDYHGGDAPSKLGKIELERFSLGDHVSAGRGGSDVFIKAEDDNALGLPALHYKRSAHFRRAEVRMLDHDIKEGKTYYVGFTLRLTNSRPGLVFFQWKKADKFVSPRQNIPFHMEFVGRDELTLGYTTPGGNGSQRKPVWRGKFSTGNSTSHIHKVAFAINTKNDGSGWLEFYLDGVKQTFDNGQDRLKNVYLFTGRTFPKLGIYRGEAAVGNERNTKDHVFNSFVYRVQISDRSLDEIAEAGGIGGSAPEPEPEPTSSNEPEPTSSKPPKTRTKKPKPTTTPAPEPEPTSSEEQSSEPPSTSTEPEATPSEDASPTTTPAPSDDESSESSCKDKKRRREERRSRKRRSHKHRRRHNKHKRSALAQ
ncbi:hypothetical protein AURDEDRAFT_179764 [Auricularia subglabra TFB-10046 SS5]|nr:hypothetical protein AURDEDRAFT_179764 [Auricularia subglabra TFB-10046 SS5]